MVVKSAEDRDKHPVSTSIQTNLGFICTSQSVPVLFLLKMCDYLVWLAILAAAGQSFIVLHLLYSPVMDEEDMR